MAKEGALSLLDNISPLLRRETIVRSSRVGCKELVLFGGAGVEFEIK